MRVDVHYILHAQADAGKGLGRSLNPPPHPTPEKMFLSENVIFQGFPWVILVNKPLSVTQLNIFSTSFHCGLIDILSLKVELIFSMGILEVVRWLTSKADYNGPKTVSALFAARFQEWALLA